MSSMTDQAGSGHLGIDSPVTTIFDFGYTDGREQLLRLYDKGTRRQWIGSDRIDWTLEIDPDNPVGWPDEMIPIAGTPWWEAMDETAAGRGPSSHRSVALQPVHAR